jgi:hypothetical protein
MKRLSIILIIISSVSLAMGQQFENDTVVSKINYELDLGVGTYYQFSTFGNTAFNSVKTSQLLPRRASNPAVRDNWCLGNNFVSDNPFFHGSYFFKFGGKFAIGENLKITGSVNAEQRGFSDGVFSKQTRNFYPYFNAIYFNKKGKFSYLIQIGDFWDLKLYEGLTFNNLETQSWVFKLKYGNFFVKHVGIGDLLIGIGLGIVDLYDYSFGLEKVSLNQDSTLSLDLKFGYSNNRGSLGEGFRNFSTKIDYNNNYSFYSQLSINNSGNTAFLVGVNSELNLWSKVAITSNLEYRNYSSGFNLGYKNTVYYRNPEEGALFTNSSNNVFIPLDYYERNFNQWAIFTEYQSLNINGLNLQSNIKYNFKDNTFCNLGIDFNWLNTENENILYPFFKLGFGIAPIQSTEISLEITNKVLNLDKDFPSFYSSNTPYLMLRLYKPLKFIKENDRQHRK